ncbi:hypothetical protein ACFYXC_13265 [Streptomyces sp. NPDC002701]|uniref:hypothetical protein n=1 Tax=Streptomyces sp. NPDC002701 TaxID=3364661 RepID=UPI003684F921
MAASAYRSGVYDGDEPSPFQHLWQDTTAAWEETLTQARADPTPARELLGMLTGGCRTLDDYEKERACLYGEGIPAELLPGTRTGPPRPHLTVFHFMEVEHRPRRFVRRPAAWTT